MKPRVSVVIPCYNHARYVGEAVQSVLAQTFDDFEVLIVDDGSTDDTLAALRPYASRIRYRHQANTGPGAARNAGIAAAAGQYVAFLDADDAWLPDKLQAQVDALDAEPDASLVYTDAALVDASRQWVWGLHSERFPHPRGRILPVLLLGNVIPSPTPMVPRRLFEQVGGFDTTLRASEDWDMWIRLARVATVAYIDRPLAQYRLHPDNAHRDLRRLRTCALAVLGKVLGDPSLPPELWALRHRATAAVLAEMGLASFEACDYGAARGDLLRAATLAPRLLLSARFTRCLGAALLGLRMATALRDIHHSLARVRG